jgi:hypothetical protein
MNPFSMFDNQCSPTPFVSTDSRPSWRKAQLDYNDPRNQKCPKPLNEIPPLVAYELASSITHAKRIDITILLDEISKLNTTHISELQAEIQHQLKQIYSLIPKNDTKVKEPSYASSMSGYNNAMEITNFSEEQISELLKKGFNPTTFSELQSKMSLHNQMKTSAQMLIDNLSDAASTLMSASISAEYAGDLLMVPIMTPNWDPMNQPPAWSPPFMSPQDMEIEQQIDEQTRTLPPVPQCCLYCDVYENEYK